MSCVTSLGEDFWKPARSFLQTLLHVPELSAAFAFILSLH